jgi:hypothetical protein
LDNEVGFLSQHVVFHEFVYFRSAVEFFGELSLHFSGIPVQYIANSLRTVNPNRPQRF